MNKIQILIDALFGALLMGFFSYFSQLYSDNPHYIRIIAFIWAMPTLFFYFLFMSSRVNKQSMYDFTKHGLIGLFFTLIAMIFTYLLINYSKNMIILLNLIFLLLITSWYFYFEIYTYF